MRASTLAAPVRIGRAGGAVVASTGGGPIEVGAARGEVNLRNSGGPVRVAPPRRQVRKRRRRPSASPTFPAACAPPPPSAASWRNCSPAAHSADSFLTTGRGDITVVIPSNVGVRVYAEAETASNVRRIVSDFPGINTRVRGGQVIAEGDINGGGPVLRILGTGGTIFIKRQ